MEHKSVGIQQNATESVGFVVGRRNFSGCRIKEQSALDNPRADVYNKDKERRCPCKRLAPHRLLITKSNDRQSLGDCGRSFLFVVIAIIVRDPRLTIRVLTSIIEIRKGAVRANG